MLSNKEVLDGIFNKDPSVINYLYKSCLPVLTKWMKKNNGTVDDSNDIFQEAFLILFRKLNVEGEKIELRCSFNTYFFSICKHLWFQELRVRSKISPKIIEEFCDHLVSESYEDIEDKKFNIYVKLLNQLESKCRDLFLLYCEGRSLTEIMSILGFKNAQAVADKKKNCRKKLIGYMLNSKEYKELQDDLFFDN